MLFTILTHRLDLFFIDIFSNTALLLYLLYVLHVFLFSGIIFWCFIKDKIEEYKEDCEK